MFLLSLSTKQTVECNVNWLHHPSKGTPFPCDNFNCLVEKFELLKTETGGYLLKEQEFQTSSNLCQNFDCWIEKFNIEQTSYGFELKLKKEEEETQQEESIFKSIFKTSSQNNPNQPQRHQTSFDIFQTFKTEEDVESNLEEDFYDMFY